MNERHESPYLTRDQTMQVRDYMDHAYITPDIHFLFSSLSLLLPGLARDLGR
jgi:hypothetical protein